MAFKTTDFKKTTRASGDARLLYPYQIRDDRYTASIGYAIAYYERMLGRRRAEFESETLLEFFGDARLARGLVACLARTYAWRQRTFAEVLGEETAQALRRAGIAEPADLRAKLYGLANGRYGGVILPHERRAALEYLCAKLSGHEPNTELQQSEQQSLAPSTQPATLNTFDSAHPTQHSSLLTPHSSLLTPDQFEQALTLDSEDHQVLIKIGPTPEPREIVARYNYHSIETALCHAELLRLHMRGPIWGILRSAHNLARRYRLRYEVSKAPRTLFDEQIEVTLYGGRDALGSWTRAGRRLARALLRLLAAHPNSLIDGEARVHLRGQTLTLRLDDRARAVLGSSSDVQDETPDAWEHDLADSFARAWGRAFVRGRTVGWRLRRDPEPLIVSGGVVVPDFALVRGRERLALCLAPGRASAEALGRDLARMGTRAQALVVVPSYIAESLRVCPAPLASYESEPSEAIPALVATLERRYPRACPEETLTPWQRLERLIAEEGFVGEAAAAAILGCPPDEAARMVQRWGGPSLHALPGLGICAPEALDEIKHLIEESGALRQAA